MFMQTSMRCQKNLEERMKIKRLKYTSVGSEGNENATAGTRIGVIQ